MARTQSPKTSSKKAPLVLYAARESDGYTYSLSFESAEWVKAHHPTAHPFPRLFLAQNIKEDFADKHQRLAPQLVSLLLGVSSEEASSLGEVIFQDPETERVLFIWRAAESSEKSRGGTAKERRSTPKHPLP